VWTLLELKPLVIEVEKSTYLLNEVTVADSVNGWRDSADCAFAN
jgi:hypothetical protein